MKDSLTERNLRLGARTMSHRCRTSWVLIESARKSEEVREWCATNAEKCEVARKSEFDVTVRCDGITVYVIGAIDDRYQMEAVEGLLMTDNKTICLSSVDGTLRHGIPCHYWQQTVSTPKE